MRILNFSDICIEAGFIPGADGKVNLPATDEVAEALGAAALKLVLEGKTSWSPGDPIPDSVTLTGPGPIWGHLAVAHSLHGCVPGLVYSGPNATVKIYGHGV